MPTPRLPIDDALPELLARLSERPAAVLQAPPGAGKTTKVPLALLEADWADGARIVMLEPRRVAARAAAARMADLLGETVGRTVGYRIRDEARVGPATRIEVVTEGVLTRRLQTDPALSGVACVIFDEFHERSIHADLGLALCLEVQALRGDLRLLVMSATLDGAGVAALLGGAPIVTSEGRSHPVETRWLDAPLRAGSGAGRPAGGAPRLEQAAAEKTAAALEASPGDALVFLPGAREIRGAVSALERRVPSSVDVLPLYGELPFAAQQAALAPPASGRRKIVVASAIAETSLTIDGVRIVVDAGRARRARFDPASGMGRLVTERVSRAAADQRRGRAGRTAPGVCWRLWTRAEEGGFAAYDPPEILEADLAPLALDLAAWGARPGELAFLDPPPEAAYAQAVALLQALGALDAAGRITAHGRALARAPLHPRLAHMVLTAGGGLTARRLAALLEDRDPLRGLGETDVAKRLAAAADPRAWPAQRGALERIAAAADRLAKRLPAAPATLDGLERDPGALLALAYPDRIGARRKGAAPRYLLSGGKGAALPDGAALSAAPFLVAAALDGDAREAGVRLAAPVAKSALETLFAGRLVWEETVAWSKRDRAVSARRRRLLGAAPLEDVAWKDAPEDRLAAALAAGLRPLALSALPCTPAAERFRARVARARTHGAETSLPDLSDAALLADLDAWLTPHLAGRRSAADLAGLDLAAILAGRLDYAAAQALDRLVPAHFTAPTGTRAPIDFSGPQPRVAIRLQELFGLTAHPRVAGEPLLLDLLSPAARPIQTTADLPGFWAGSYAEVRKDMRARYPKHPWPENPAQAEPTRRAKPRKG